MVFIEFFFFHLGNKNSGRLSHYFSSSFYAVTILWILPWADSALVALNKWLSGFDLTTHDSHFKILVEVFTNCILAEKIYFMNHMQ